MKFSAALIAGFAAVSQVQATPEPQLGDILDGIGDAVSDIGDWASDVRTAFDSLETSLDDIVDDASGAWSDVRASITQKVDEVMASLSAAAATNTDAQEASSQIAAYQSDIDRIVAEASQAVEDNDGNNNDDDEDAGSLTTVSVALAGVIGGAALFFNL